MTRSALPLGVAFLAFSLFAAGCDTVAEISFQSRNFSELHSTGFITPSGPDGERCGTLGTGSEAGTTNFRFVMLDDRSPSQPYVAGEGARVDIDDDLRVEFSNGRVFEPEDVTCSDTSDCDISGYACTNALSTNDSAQRRCGANTGFDRREISFIRSEEKREQDNVIGLVVENGATTRGAYPARINGRWYDSNGDGNGDTQFGSVSNDRSSDPRRARHAAMRPFVSNWNEVSQYSQGTTHFGLWALNSEGNPASAVNYVDGGNQQQVFWSSNRGKTGDYVDAIAENQVSETSELVRPLVAINNLIEGPFSEFENADKTLVVVVDGPPEHPFSAPSNLNLPDDVIDTARDNGVRVYITQFDTRVDPSLYPDSQAYWQLQSGNCSSDSDCQSWEVCREVNGFSDTDGGAVSPEPNGTYCMPKRRDSDGRTGPISVYSEIACATGGGYQYIKSPYAISNAIGWLPHETDGMWEVEVGVNEIDVGAVEANGPTRLQSSVEVTLDGTSSQTLNFSQEGFPVESPTNVEPDVAAPDNRSTLFIGETGN